MKIKLLITSFLFLTCTFSFSQVGIGTTNPNVNSALDITSSDKGVLMPRVALSATNDPSPLSSHVAGMTVYNTATAGSMPNQVIPGFYINDGTKWIRTYTSDGAIDAKWVNKLSGSVELLNLSDGATVRPVGTEFVALDNGNVGIGTTAASDKLTVDIKDKSGTGISIIGADNITKAINFAEIGPLGQGQINWRKTGLEAALAASIRSVGNDTYANKGIGFFTGYYEDYINHAVERMRLTATGRLGIGTTTPDARVHIAYDPTLVGLNVEGITFDVDANNKALISYPSSLTIRNTSSNRLLTLKSDDGSIILNAKNAYPGGMFLQTGDITRMEIIETSANNYDGIAIYDSSSNMTARFGRLGRVGIGTSTPTEKLEINGALKVGDGGYTGVTDGATTPAPAGGAGTIIFSSGHFYGWTGSVWKQMDN